MFLNCQMRIEAELEDMAMEYERTHAAAIITEKRGKNFDKVCFLSLSLHFHYIQILSRLWANGKRRQMICTPSWTLATPSAATSALRPSA